MAEGNGPLESFKRDCYPYLPRICSFGLHVEASVVWLKGFRSSPRKLSIEVACRCQVEEYYQFRLFSHQSFNMDSCEMPLELGSKELTLAVAITLPRMGCRIREDPKENCIRDSDTGFCKSVGATDTCLSISGSERWIIRCYQFDSLGSRSNMIHWLFQRVKLIR